MLTAREQPGRDVADRDPDLHRPAALVVRLAGDRHQPADRLRDEVVAGLPGVRPGRPEPGDREVDEVRVELPEDVVAEPEPGEPADPVVLDEHVRVADEPAEDLAPGLLLEVEADRALVAVDREVVGGRPRAVGLAPDPRRAPGRVTSPSGGSTLITSAPRSARSIVASGPARTVEQSATRMPASGPVGASLMTRSTGRPCAAPRGR